MKKKFVKRLLSGLLAAVLLVCMLPMTAFAQETQVTISNQNSKDNSTLALDDPIWEVAGSPEIILGEPSLISPKQTTYEDAESGKSYELAKIQYLYFVGSDYTVKSIEENLGNYIVTFPKGASNINIIYGWDITESSNPEDPEAPIYNYIKTLNRTVKQHGWALNPTKNEADIDTYAVYTEKNIYLNYDATMDMEELGSVAFGQASWDILNMHSEEIYDETTVNLHFQFDPNVIDVNKFTDDSFQNADLQSDMFTLKGYKINKEANELILICNWDGKKAAEAKAENGGKLDPIIRLTGVLLPIEESCLAGENASVKVENHGYVDGFVKADDPMTDKEDPKIGQIDGGEKDDTFILVKNDEKISKPGMIKNILLPDGSQVDSDTVAVGDTVTFQLNSTVPQDLNIVYESKDEDKDGFADGTAKGEYLLTFHDDMADAFELLNDENFKVMIGDKVLDADDYSMIEPTDGCDFEIQLNLVELYNAGIIEDSYLGLAPIIVTYEAKLKDETPAGKYVNTAWVTFNEEESSHDTAEVETFGIKVYKFDQADATKETPLEGAVFELKNLDTGKIVTGTSGADGFVIFNGLDEGNYVLRETQAPNDYVCSNTPIDVVVEKGGENVEEYYVTVEFANSKIPHTGGMGTTIFSIVGGVLIAMAGTVFVISRRKRRA